MSNIIEIKQIVFRNIYVFAYICTVYMHVKIINEKRERGCERQQEGEYERA